MKPQEQANTRIESELYLVVKMLVFKVDGDGGEGTDHNQLEAELIINVDAIRNNMEIVARKKQGEDVTIQR